MKIKIQKINNNAVIPHYVHKGDVGMDLYSVEDVVLLAGERKLIGTGLKFEIPMGFELQIRPKSGLAVNFGVTVLNTPGTIDCGYRGEVKVILFNSSKNDYQIKKEEKIAQAVIARVEEAEIEEVEELSETTRGDGGFGSTGLKK
ncbi:MAG: dUTP diphosphatase [bacterium]|nr:dUTP diphosphatase [bacterium]